MAACATQTHRSNGDLRLSFALQTWQKRSCPASAMDGEPAGLYNQIGGKIGTEMHICLGPSRGNDPTLNANGAEEKMVTAFAFIRSSSLIS
mmetsp:Transcript_62840/g.101280  ORF Transcript_62840/g.101280 Transcript_62840/m.101280 type:complete len:91 (-) Transcript_62840:403-675(-)